MVSLRGKTIELLATIIEDTRLEMKKITEGLLTTLDFKAIHETLEYFYNQLQIDKLAEEADKGLFKTYHVLMHLADHHPDETKSRIGIECI